MKQITQTEVSDGYKLEVICTETIDLLDCKQTEDYIVPALYESIVDNITRFISETGKIPTKATVSGKVKTRMIRYLQKDTNEDKGEVLKSETDRWDEEPAIRFCTFSGENVYLVRLTSNCKVENDNEIVIQYAVETN